MTKKIISLFLLVVMVFVIGTGCAKSSGESAKSTDDAGNTPSEATEDQTEQETAEVDDSEEAWKSEPMYGQKIPVGFLGANCVGACYVAEILGFNDEEGLDVDVTSIAPPDAMNAISAGKILLTENHISATTVPIVNGIQATMVGTAQTGCQSMYVLADSQYNSLSDLVGKNVNLPRGIGSMDHNIVLRFMGRDGLSSTDFNFKNTEMSATIQGMQNGELDATLLTDQFAYQFVADGVIRPIRSLTWDEDFATEPCCVVLVNNDFMKQNPITCKKLVRATAKASAWIDSHTEDAVKLMLDNQIASGEVDMLNEMQASYDWTVTNEKCEETLRDVIKSYKEFELIDASLNEDDIFKAIWNPIIPQDELDAVWEEGKAFSANL